MSNNWITFEEVSKLVVYAMTAWDTFKHIHYTEVQESISNGAKFLNFSPNGRLYSFSKRRHQNGISVRLKGLKKKNQVRDALITQINFIIDEYNTRCQGCK